METYRLHMHRAAFNRLKECASVYIERNEWLPVEALSNLFGCNLSGIFGTGNLGWRPTTLAYHFQTTDLQASPLVVVSVPKPEEIPACPDGRTIREQMDDLASRERPALEDWLSKNGIGNGAQSSEKVCMQNALAILRRMNEAPYSLYPELVEQLTEMRTLTHTLIGTGENCCDETVYEHAEAVRKTTRLDAADALSYAIRAMLDNKGLPGVKTALNSMYGIAAYDGDRLDDALKHAEKSYVKAITDALNGNPEEQAADNDQLYTPGPENVRDDDTPALFVTIETGTFDATLENVEAVRAFISDAGEGRDIHLRII